MKKYFLIGTIAFLVMGFITLHDKAFGEEKDKAERWARLNKKAKKLYGGYDLTVKVKAGLPIPSIENNDDQQNPFSAVSENGGLGIFGKLLVEVPLYSKDIKRKKEAEKRDFLKNGYEYIKTINEGLEELKILREKSMVLKAVMKDEGVTSITAYYDVLSEINKFKNMIVEADMNFEAMVRK